MAENKVNISEISTSRIIITLLIVAAVFALLSLGVVWILTHNFYAASYYTMSALFDANGEGASSFIAAALGAGTSGAFYAFIVISLIDGLAKAVIIGFVIAAFVELLANIDIKSKIEGITAKRMKNQIIICGYSMLAERLCKDLKKEGAHFLIIDKDQEKVNLLHDLNYNVIEGDFTSRKVLEGASLSNAKAVVFATESDFVNLLGIVTAHHMVPNVKIMARARSEASVRKLQRGGAELCVVPEVVAGVELGEVLAKL